MPTTATGALNIIAMALDQNMNARNASTTAVTLTVAGVITMQRSTRIDPRSALPISTVVAATESDAKHNDKDLVTEHYKTVFEGLTRNALQIAISAANVALHNEQIRNEPNGVTIKELSDAAIKRDNNGNKIARLTTRLALIVVIKPPATPRGGLNDKDQRTEPSALLNGGWTTVGDEPKAVIELHSGAIVIAI